MMKIVSTLFGILLIAFLSSLIGCVKSTEVGSDLIENEANVQYVDTLPLIITTTSPDSVKTYDTLSTSTIYPFGLLNDSLLGTARSSLYAEFRLDSLKPNFDGIASLDSVVLFLALDSSRVYGSNTDQQSIEIYRLTENMPAKSNLYSNQTFATESSPITTHSFYPNINKRIFEYDSSTSVAYERIPLPLSFGNDLLQILKDTNKTNSYSNFTSFFKGLKLKPVKETNTLLSLDLTKYLAGISTSTSVTNITMYYHDASGKAQQSRLGIGNYAGNLSARSLEYNHTYNDAFKPFIGNKQLSTDSLFAIEGLGGVSTKIELPEISTTNSTILINKAELELNAIAYRPPLNNIPRIFVTRKKSDGTFALIRDVLEGSSIYGGSVETYYEGNGVFRQKYKINLAAHYQDAMKPGSGVSLEIYLIPENKAYSPVRTLFYGTKNKTFAPKLRLTYTKVK